MSPTGSPRTDAISHAPTSREWASIAAAALLLDVSEKTVRRRIADGTLEAVRFGPRLIRVNLASLETAGCPLQYMGGAA